jgi:hypothetical protein
MQKGSNKESENPRLEEVVPISRRLSSGFSPAT